jgi:hypothetical protein
MLFIDWISTPDHRNFNRSFFSAIKLKNPKCIVFSEKLVVPEAECLFIARCDGRVRRAITILNLVRKNKGESIIFVTYDSLFLPFVSFFKKTVLVFEHNTTPEDGWSKHLIWQKLFFGRIHRMAQFPPQYDRLLRIENNVTYIGSPLMPVKDLKCAENKLSEPPLFIVPSYRIVISELDRYADLLADSTIYAKKTARASPLDVQSSRQFTVRYVDRIEFCHDGRKADAVIITIQSRFRGTGWFNDSISNRIPIIITSPDTKLLFMETFTGYPFVSLDRIKTQYELRQLLDQVQRFDSEGYINSHNAHLCARFYAMCTTLNIKIE